MAHLFSEVEKKNDFSSECTKSVNASTRKLVTFELNVTFQKTFQSRCPRDCSASG